MSDIMVRENTSVDVQRNNNLWDLRISIQI